MVIQGKNLVAIDFDEDHGLAHTHHECLGLLRKSLFFLTHICREQRYCGYNSRFTKGPKIKYELLKQMGLQLKKCDFIG